MLCRRRKESDNQRLSQNFRTTKLWQPQSFTVPRGGGGRRGYS